MKRFGTALAAAALAFFLVFPFTGCRKTDSATPSGGTGHQTAATVREDRFGQIFSADGDAGNLTARFLKLETATEFGSGDSTILTSPDGKVMLIDGGSPDCGPQIEAYLRAMNVTRLDAVVATHPHIDHIGGLSHIIRTFPIDVLYMTRVEHGTDTYRDFISTVSDREVRVEYLEEGSEFAFGNEVKVTVFNPEREIEYYEGFPDNSTQFINNRSLVMKFTFRDSTMLFMSDVYMAREDELMQKFGGALQADIVKAGHHGKETSSSRPFVQLLSPKITVILHDSVASTMVYNNYRKAGAGTYITFLDGSVKVVADGTREYRVLTQFDRQSDFLK